MATTNARPGSGTFLLVAFRSKRKAPNNMPKHKHRMYVLISQCPKWMNGFIVLTFNANKRRCPPSVQAPSCEHDRREGLRESVCRELNLLHKAMYLFSLRILQGG